jgi:O-antigen/teichoic acid export membrane protein
MLIRSGKTAIIVSVLASALAQMILLRTSFSQMENSGYQKMVQAVSLGSIVYLFILGPVVTLTALSEASENSFSKTQYTLTIALVRKMKDVLLCFLGLFFLANFLFGDENWNIAIFTVMFYLITGYQFSFNRGLFMGRKQWFHVAKQLLAESVVKISLSVFLLLSRPSNSALFFACIWMPQLLTNYFFGKKRQMNSGKQTKWLNSKTIKPSFSILGGLWMSSVAGVAASSIPILLTSFNKNYNSEEINNLANIFFVCRMPLSLSGAVLGPLLVEIVSGKGFVNSRAISRPIIGFLCVLLFGGMTVFNLVCVHLVFGTSQLSSLLNIALLTLSTILYLFADIFTLFSIRDRRFKSLKICWTISMIFMVFVLLLIPEAQLTPVVVLISSAILVILLFADRIKSREIN